MLPHDRLPVYARALACVGAAEGVALLLPLDRPDLRDQLRRAAASVVLNIAEGAGEFSAGEKARFYRIARRSANEACAILDVARAVVPRPPEVGALREDLVRVIMMLDKLIFVQQRRRV